MSLKVVRATGIFADVRRAGVARRVQGDADASAVGGTLELSLDNWEAPIVFDVTSVERDAHGATVYRGTAPRAAGSPEAIAILVEAATPPPGAPLGMVRHAEVTRSTEGSPPDSVLELRGDDSPPQ